MAFTLTKFIYPLKEKLVLSEHLKYYFDNPRTEKEIQFVKEYVSKSLRQDFENSKPYRNPMLSASFAIGDYRDYMRGKDEYVYNYYLSNLDTTIEDIICQTWVILRYDDNGVFDKILLDKMEVYSITTSERKYPYWENYNNLLSYCNAVSLLCHDDADKYIGDSFVLLKKPYDIFYPKSNMEGIIQTFNTFYAHCLVACEQGKVSWNFFPDTKNKLVEVCENFEKKLSTNDEGIKKKNRLSFKDKILFVGDLLRIVENETHDVKVKLLLLVSIIEFMVTRKPDANKFNVEDSIMKQFVLKASILIYNDHPDLDLPALKENLHRIYNQRSDVAHGNFLNTNDNRKMLESFYLLYKYIRAIMNNYIKDSKFVDYIKEN